MDMNMNVNRDPQVEQVWRSYLTTGKVPEHIKVPWYESASMRAVARRLPADPRCQVCYYLTTNTIYEYGGMVATLVGDGVAAFFVPAFAEDRNYARAAVRAGRAILAATGHGKTDRPWVPVGVGVHTGDAYVGSVGEPGKHIDITVLGDSVNVAARLSGQAQEGEMVISEATVRKGGLDTTGHEFRSLTLKGKEEPFDAWVYRAGAP